MLARSSVTNAGIHGDGYAEAGLPGAGHQQGQVSASASWNCYFSIRNIEVEHPGGVKRLPQVSDRAGIIAGELSARR
jgi:hypothetical protein